MRRVWGTLGPDCLCPTSHSSFPSWMEPVGLVVAGAVSLYPAEAPAFLGKKMVTLDQARGV